VVRNLPLTFDRRVPAAPPLHPGNPRVVEAWNRKAKSDLRTLRLVVFTLAAMAVAGAVAEVLPAVLAVLALGAVAVAYPLALVSAGGRAAQKPFDIFEEGAHGTERRNLLRFRRFAPFPEIVRGEAREAAAGKFHVVLTLIDGTTIESVPGEVSPEGVRFLVERTGEQVTVRPLPARGEKSEQRNS
jgi:hypothetical protein